MEIEQQYKEFRKIIDKYRFTQKAEKIAQSIMGKTITAKTFAKDHGMQIKEAQIFLSFIQKGIDYKTRCMK